MVVRLGEMPAALIVAGALLVSSTVGAQMRQAVTVDAGATGVLPLESEATIASFAAAELDLRSAPDPHVRGRLQLRATALDPAEDADGEDVLLELLRASASVRLPVGGRNLTLTAGRARLTWGDGQVFNAGDTINGARAATLDLTDETLRDETVWLAAARLPLGRFSFLEAVALPSVSSGAWWEQTAGGRIQGQIAGVKSELSYLQRGADEAADVALSLQGNIVIDVYTATSATMMHSEVDWVSSVGVYHLGTVGRGDWSIRIEGLVDWQEEDVLLYPELTWSPSPLFTVFGRSEILPDGNESRSGLGVRWDPATGMTLSLVVENATAGAGGAPVEGQFAVTTSIRYVF